MRIKDVASPRRRRSVSGRLYCRFQYFRRCCGRCRVSTRTSCRTTTTTTTTSSSYFFFSTRRWWRDHISTINAGEARCRVGLKIVFVSFFPLESFFFLFLLLSAFRLFGLLSLSVCFYFSLPSSSFFESRAPFSLPLEEKRRLGGVCCGIGA